MTRDSQVLSVERRIRSAVDGVLVAFVWLPAGALLWEFTGWAGLVSFGVGVLISSAWDFWRAWKVFDGR